MEDFSERRGKLSAPKRALLEKLLRGKSKKFRESAIPRREQQGQAPISFAQQRLWFLDQLEPGNPAYNISAAVQLDGALDLAALERSFNGIFERHESLRSSFVTIDDYPVVVIAPEFNLKLGLTDLSYLPAEQQKAEVIRLAKEESHQSFDLARGPLARIKVYHLEQDRHVTLLTMHHIISDGWSMSVFVRELAALYEAYSTGQTSPLAELSIQYADYAQWQRYWLTGDVLEEQLSYWKEQLSGELTVLNLPSDRPRPSVQTHNGARHYVRLAKPLTEALNALSQRQGVTLFMTLLAALKVLLHSYSSQDDITVGTSIAGRNRAEIGGLIGFFLNSLALRTDLSGNPTFVELLSRVREVALGAYANQDLPVEMLLEVRHLERDLSHNPLFQVMLILQNTPEPVLSLPNLTLFLIDIDTATAKFDLTLDLREKPDGIEGWFEYNTDLFDAGTISRLSGHFETLLQAITADPNQRISTLPLLTRAETAQLKSWNETSANYSPELPVHRMFEQQAKRTPSAVAVMSEGRQLTYAELNERANQLARYLKTLGGSADTIVGICLDRSPEMIVTLLAILKAGGAYLPIDPSYPKHRIEYMVEDARISLLLTERRLRDRFPESVAQAICLDTDWQTIAQNNAQGALVEVGGEDLAYVLYTSGSTGKPKAVKIRHRSLANYVRAAVAEYGLNPEDRVLQFASISFDTSAEEIYPCLSSGAMLVLRADSMLSTASAFMEQCGDWGITVLDLPTAYWHELAAELEQGGFRIPESLRLIIIGGERALPESVKAWSSRLGDRQRLVNTYGPTEATIVATLCDLSSSTLEAAGAEVPIGRPIPNASAHVLNKYLQQVPIGVPGQLHIGGAGLARGYLNRPDLTAERFMPDPFSDEPGARLYRTGDLVRRLSDGNLQYLGRADQQVKIRGFRVEPGEIEAALREHGLVSDVIVLPRQDGLGLARLVAYCIAAQSQPPTTDQLRRHLSERLPDYMVPSAFVFIDAFPLTPNRKIDRQALLALDQPRSESSGAFVAARNPIEEVLVGIWSELLEVQPVGIYDNFFELGGHSLLATRLISRVREAFQVDVPLRAIFESRALASLAEQIETLMRANHGTQLPPIAIVPRDQELPLSFSQERLWLLHQLHPESAAYHVLRPMRLRGLLNVPFLENTVEQVVCRHEIYRTTIGIVNERPVQIIHPPQPFTLPITDLRGASEATQEAFIRELIAEEGQQPFDLVQGPLWRLKLIRLGEEDHLLMLTEHHLVHDGWTEGRLALDFLRLYAAFYEGKPSPLPELSVQYADFAHWQRQTLQGEVLDKLLSYWREHLAGAPSALEMPTDKPRPPVVSFRGANISFEFPSELTDALNTLSRRKGATLYMTLMAAFKALLHRYSGQEDIVVGAPVANRTSTATEYLTGFFVNTLAMRTDLSGNPSFVELLNRVREVAIGAYTHQDMPFERLVEELQPERSLSRQPLFQVMFVLQNAPSPPLDLPGLTVEAIGAHNGTSKFDLLLSMREADGHLTAVMEYSTDLFEEATIKRMLMNFQTLLEAVASNPDRRISELPLVAEAERHQVLFDWNDTRVDYQIEKSVAGLFEEQAERTPKAIAAISEREQVSYEELNRRANQLAHYLKSLGVGPDVPVGISIDRSIEMLVAVLGTIKAGGAYVPLDRAYPDERLAFMFDDARPPVLVTQRAILDKLPASEVRAICLDEDVSKISAQSDQNPTRKAGGENLCYVIYTSGSTGKPKGVAMRHGALVNLIEWQLRRPGFSGRARTLQFASLSFDVAFQEIFSTWASGGALVMLTEELRQDIAGLVEYIAEKSVERLFLPFVALQQLARETDRSGAVPQNLKQVITAGEQLQITKPIAEMFDKLEGCVLENQYGPSESHVVSEHGLRGRAEDWPLLPPIGKPISNTELYVLDINYQPTPIGVPGELYIGGECLARGYLNRPELTAEMFLPNPFARRPGERIYKTGDLVRYLPDANLEYLGRNDFQVKIRGFRVELGEVEAVLAQHLEVREVAVAAIDDSTLNKQLVAYIVARQGAKLEPNNLRNWLKDKLPMYEVPSIFMLLDELPLTPSGKLDRRALPLLDHGRRAIQSDYSPPESDLQRVLLDIWSQTLGIEQIGIRDNFFELGGHSLLATQLVSRVRDTFEVELPLRSLFEGPSIENMADLVEKALLEKINQLSEEEAKQYIAGLAHLN